jgi:type VI secretion system secreted protein VgrG
MPEMNQIVEFEGGGLAPETFEVRSLEGFEEISGLYRFRLELWSSEKKIKIEDLLSKAARIGLHRLVTTSDGKPATALYNIYGMPSSFEQLERANEQVHYTAEIVPRFWRLSRTSQSRILQNLSVPTMIEQLLTDSNTYAMKSGDDFEFKGTASYVDREFTVQYQETDLAFVSRLLEHEGIFYIFRQEEDREKLIFADANTAFEPIAGTATLKYQAQGNIVAADGVKAREDEVIFSWSLRQEEGPEKVQLADWNHRDPEVKLVVEEPVDPNGKGKVYEYGNHYKTQSEGKSLAKVRAEAILCRLKRFEGTSNCRRFKAGAKFTLDGHYRDDFNADYIVVSVHHRVIQHNGKSAGGATNYENSFVAIPASAVFRPERRTPVPKIQGLMPGLVHAPDDAESPEIDDDGKYRVKFAFDILEPKDASAPPSRPIRAAQPSTGPDHGFHAPLRGKSEAVVGFSEGNPDRPVILASVPNPKNGSPVKGANKSQQMWKSSANNMVLFDDKKDAEKIFVHGQKDMHFRVQNDSVTWVGRDHHINVKQHVNEKIEGNQNKSVVGNEVKKIDGNKELTLAGDSVSKVTGNISLKVDGDVAEVVKGDHAEDCSGKVYVKATGITLEATSGITIKCGSSSIVIDGSGVTVNGMLIANSTSIKMAMGPGSPAEAGKPGSASDPPAPEVPIKADEPQTPGSGDGQLGSGGGASAIPSPAPAPPPHQSDPAKTHWIEVELVDQDNHPAAGVRYEIKLPTGQMSSGYLDEHGKARIEGTDSGSCEISFPQLDKNDWEPA